MDSLHNEEYIEIITRLRAIRINSNITQNELASTLGITQSLVSKVENCERRLDIVEFFAWAKALDVPWYKIIPVKYITKEIDSND